MKKLKYHFWMMGMVFIFGWAAVLTNAMMDPMQWEELLFSLLKVMGCCCISFFLPEVMQLLKKRIQAGRNRQELRFLKKLFVLCGSVKPVDYQQVLKQLISRSVYYKEALENIQEAHKKSNVDQAQYYHTLLSQTKELDVRLFFEKLDLASNYDFEQAVAAIANDFVQEKREQARRTKKKVEEIHIFGIVGLFILITLLMLYLLGPWLEQLRVTGIV